MWFKGEQARERDGRINRWKREGGKREGGKRGGGGERATEQAICHESWDIVCRRFTRSTPGTEQYKRRRPLMERCFTVNNCSDDQLAQYRVIPFYWSHRRCDRSSHTEKFGIIEEDRREPLNSFVRGSMRPGQSFRRAAKRGQFVRLRRIFRVFRRSIWLSGERERERWQRWRRTRGGLLLRRNRRRAARRRPLGARRRRSSKVRGKVRRKCKQVLRPTRKRMENDL